MTTKDILIETLGSLNFPDAAWDELAEKIDNNKSTLEKIQEIASDEPSPWLKEARKRQEERETDKFSEGYGQGLEHGDAQAKVETPDDIQDFVGKTMYDDHGQMIFRGVDKDNLQMFLDVRGWGAIQNMGFKTEQEMMDFQDKVGRWVSEVINNNLKD